MTNIRPSIEHKLATCRLRWLPSDQWLEHTRNETFWSGMKRGKMALKSALAKKSIFGYWEFKVTNFENMRREKKIETSRDVYTDVLNYLSFTYTTLSFSLPLFFTLSLTLTDEQWSHGRDAAFINSAVSGKSSHHTFSRFKDKDNDNGDDHKRMQSLRISWWLDVVVVAVVVVQCHNRRPKQSKEIFRPTDGAMLVVLRKDVRKSYLAWSSIIISIILIKCSKLSSSNLRTCHPSPLTLNNKNKSAYFYWKQNWNCQGMHESGNICAWSCLQQQQQQRMLMLKTWRSSCCCCCSLHVCHM